MTIRWPSAPPTHRVLTHRSCRLARLSIFGIEAEWFLFGDSDGDERVCRLTDLFGTDRDGYDRPDVWAVPEAVS